MSYKQRALKLMEQLGATHVGTEYDDMFEYYTMDWSVPKGKRWIENGEHMSWTRENTLTDCWKALIKTAQMGIENCTAECDCWNWPDDEDEPNEPMNALAHLRQIGILN